MTPEREEPIDASRKQYGTGSVYGSIFEFAGGSVVQNVEMVASSKVGYKKRGAVFNADKTFLVKRNAPGW